MKKNVFVLLLAALIAAGCNSQTATNPAPDPITEPPAAPQPQPSPQPAPAKPEITALTPDSGQVNSTVKISGSGFTLTGNQIMFGPANGLHRRDGSAANVITQAQSTDGKTLTFTVPAQGPSGILCDANEHCIAVAAILLRPGTFPVAVKNANGTSNAAVFTIK